MAHMGGSGGHGEELWGSNRGLDVAAGTVSVPFSGLGRPSLGRYSHDRAYAAVQQAVQGTHRDRQTKTAIFRALHFLRGLCLCGVLGRVASCQGLQLEPHTLGGELGGGFLTLALLFPPNPSSSQLVQETGRDTPPLKTGVAFGEQCGF